MQVWTLDASRCRGSLPAARVAGLLAAIGEGDVSAFAGEVLKTIGGAVRASQCTVFAYEFSNRPRTVSVADYRGGRFLNDVADKYIQLFYELDGNQPIVSGEYAEAKEGSVLFHRQRSDEIAHEGYRQACYEKPRVSDRVALLMRPEAGIWLSVNLYRNDDQGVFGDGEIDTLESLSPILALAAKHHYALAGQHRQGTPQLMLSRLRSRCPELPKRELDVVRGVLEGRSAREIAESMGIQPSSVVTYQKRAYRRLGISSQRELFALCVAAPHAGHFIS